MELAFFAILWSILFGFGSATKHNNNNNEIFVSPFDINLLQWNYRIVKLFVQRFITWCSVYVFFAGEHAALHRWVELWLCVVYRPLYSFENGSDYVLCTGDQAALQLREQLWLCVRRGLVTDTPGPFHCRGRRGQDRLVEPQPRHGGNSMAPCGHVNLTIEWLLQISNGLDQLSKLCGIQDIMSVINPLGAHSAVSRDLA